MSIKSIFKRLFALVLSVLLIINVPISALADVKGNTSPSIRPIPVPGGKGYTLGSAAPTFDDYGFRVTISCGNLNGVITQLTEGYTDQNLDEQRDAVNEHLKHIYMEPNNNGLYFYGARRADAKLNWGRRVFVCGYALRAIKTKPQTHNSRGDNIRLLQ